KLEQARNEFQLDALAELTTRGGPPEVPAEAVEAVRQLEEKLARLGPVNMYALDEQQELEKRFGFLKVQFEDLESARSSLRDFIDQSQFVVITHNKKTMSYADILYGITMPEPGVSKRIAIKFEEIEKHLPMDEIDRAAREARKAAQAQAAAAKPAEEPAPDA